MEQADGSTPGDGGGFGDLYREHFRPLLGVSVALVGSRERAEEIVQDAFATTFDHYARLDDPVKTVRRAALRGCAGQKPVPDDPTRSTERILSRVRELPRPQRDAVALHHGLGLEAPEIDRTLGLQAGAAALRLEQAGTQLRSSLEVGNDLDHTLTRAFADTTLDLGHLLARPGEAQRRVYRRRRIRVAAGVTAAVVAAVVLFVLVRPSGETVDAGGGTTAGATDTNDTADTTDTTDTTDVGGDHHFERAGLDHHLDHAHDGEPRWDLHRGRRRRVVCDRAEAGRPRRAPARGERGDAVGPALRGPGAAGPSAGADYLTPAT